MEATVEIGEIVQNIDGRLEELRSEAQRLEAARVALRPSETPNGRRRGRPPKRPAEASD